MTSTTPEGCGWGVEKLVLYKPCLHPDSVPRRPPLEKGRQGGFPRVTTAWVREIPGSAVLRGIVASAQRIGYAS